jgi:hypothetical protein
METISTGAAAAMPGDVSSTAAKNVTRRNVTNLPLLLKTQSVKSPADRHMTIDRAIVS